MLGLLTGKRTKSRKKARSSKSRPRTRRSTGVPRKRPATQRPAIWRGHAPDALGLFVLFTAVLMALSLAGSAGPVGNGIDWLLRATFGAVAYAVPVATLVVALAAFVRREEAVRIFVGTWLLTTAVAGFVHLAGGTAPLTGGFGGLAAGGGAIGALLAVPLETYVGAWAGGLACLFLATLGVLVTTKTPLRRAAEAAWAGAGRGLVWLGRSLRAFVRFTAARLEENLRPPAPVPGGPVDLTPEAPDGEEPTEPEEEDVEPTAPVVPFPGAEGKSPAPPEQATLDLDLPTETGPYELPPLRLLTKGGSGGNRSKRSADATAGVLERTLRDFGVEASVSGFTQGPTVTRFEIELAAGVKVSKVLSLSDDMAYALGTPDVRLIAPIPGKSAIGIEVPNRDREFVRLGDITSTPTWSAAKHPLTCALGKDIAGHPVVINLAEMPHMLIAGATGAGKSSCLNTLVASLLFRARPEMLRMILIDPKMVELSHFDGLPHLLSPVVTHPKRAAETLSWVVKEMERRYEELAACGQRNIEAYNAAVRRGDVPSHDAHGERREPLPFMVVVIDELADLMMVAARQVEDSICRIAQMARAVGIHLVVATQRPSVDVVTGLIKANIPSRVAFATASQSDSRVILDMGGADKLTGNGDMLYMPAGTSRPRRLQSAYITEAEIAELTGFIREQAETAYSEEVLEAATGDPDELDDDDSSDPLIDEAMELVIRTGQGSTSMIQRRMKVGFSRAGRIMDELERKGVVGPQEGPKARDVLITPEQLEEMRQRADA